MTIKSSFSQTCEQCLVNSLQDVRTEMLFCQGMLALKVVSCGFLTTSMHNIAPFLVYELLVLINLQELRYFHPVCMIHPNIMDWGLIRLPRLVPIYCGSH